MMSYLSAANETKDEAKEAPQPLTVSIAPVEGAESKEAPSVSPSPRDSEALSSGVSNASPNLSEEEKQD